MERVLLMADQGLREVEYSQWLGVECRTGKWCGGGGGEGVRSTEQASYIHQKCCGEPKDQRK